ncbi:integrase [Pseudomonas saxonica]|uniref:Integrase n=1 Tax=Pseudomonas saxonica TaxID=2600598 RepID=A0ABY3GLV7_9PSED|nr:integrase [Pseudomonas saxonica]
MLYVSPLSRIEAEDVHYSAAELDQLIEAANKVSVTDSRAPALTILKRRQG